MKRRVSDKVAHKRLLELAVLLENLPRGKYFDFNSWGQGAAALVGDLDLNVCGTTACALGWATTLPFSKFKLRVDSLYQDGSADFVTKNGGKVAYSDTVAKEMFGLNETQTSLIFHPHGAAGLIAKAPNARSGAKAVAANIRRFCIIRFGFHYYDSVPF